MKQGLIFFTILSFMIFTFFPSFNKPAYAGIVVTPGTQTGTWTPTIFLTVSQPTSVTYGTQIGTWFKIGPLVCYTFNIALSAFTAGSGSGNAYVSGTPFSVTAAADYGGGVVTQKSNFVTNGPAALQPITNANAIGMVFDVSAGATGYSSVARANITTNTGLGGQGCFKTDQ